MAKKQIDIEKLVHWALADQQVGRASAGSDVGMLGYRSGQGAMDQMQEYGQMIQDGVVERLIASNCHMDAFATYDAAMALPQPAQALVIAHGIKGDRPDWYPEGAGQRVARIGRFGRPATIALSDGSKQVIYDWDGLPPSQVKCARAQYMVWWEGLVALTDFLKNNLEDHIPHPPRVSREPWMVAAKKVG
ncbi:hypothetical protein [Maritalea sp.]|jgi:hypothetical protein|uniref:hypothetical protein n=1 Tax=Maritalea sp. TaxID=2003361 RepID=UPI0039E35CFE